MDREEKERVRRFRGGIRREGSRIYIYSTLI